MRRIYPTPQDAEAAFYEALERADLDAMMQVWADDEEIVCVHPGGARLVGFDQVRASWASMLQSGQRMRVQISDLVQFGSGMVAVHSLHENISLQNDRRTAVSAATNIYARSGDGWHMVFHHASPAQERQARPNSPAPQTLH
jgi:ketosteroid isomerase-like protein